MIACCVLHNMCLQAGIEAPEMTEEETQSEMARQEISQATQQSRSTQALRLGQRARAALVALINRRQ